MNLHIDADGFSRYDVAGSTLSTLEIVVDKRINASLLLTYSGIDAAIEASITVSEGSSLTVMLKNEMSGEVHLKVSSEIFHDASLSLAFFELASGVSTIDGAFTLMEEGASVLLRSACLVNRKIHAHVICHHKVPFTKSVMEHYAVVEEGGDYRMEACGKIQKDAHGSESFQTTRVLTMSEDHRSEVVPLLLIDENDVKASHATTVGQPDENQLYYLQTRGIQRKQALGLLSIGYMMPLTEMFEDEKIKEQLKNEIEMKVGLHV